MGWFNFETFDDVESWEQDPSGASLFNLSYTDWPDYLTSPKKTRQVRLDFLNSGSSGSIRKVYETPYYFSFRDVHDKQTHYSNIILTYMYNLGVNSPSIHIKKPSDFMFTLAIYNDGVKLREWAIPVKISTCLEYHRELFDLKPLIEEGHTHFNEVRVFVLKHPGAGAKFYFGDLLLMEDKIMHNVSVGIADILHLKQRKYLTRLTQPGKEGDEKIILNDSVDLYKGSTLVIGDPEQTDFWELHTADDCTFTDRTATVNFGGRFSGHELLHDWPVDTPVFYDVPAIYGNVRESESPFSTYYIDVEAPEVDEKQTPLKSKNFTNYVVGDTEDDHQVAVSLSRDTLRMSVTIYVFAPNEEQAEDSWQFLRKIFNNQSKIYVAGSCYDYEVVATRDIVSTEYNDTPYYAMDLIVYPDEDVHDKKYDKFPLIKRLTAGTSDDIDNLTLVDFSVNLNGE